MKKIMKTVIILVLVISAGLISLEVYFRKFNPQIVWSSLVFPYEFSCFEKGDYFTYRLIKNKECSIRSNMDYFRPVTVKINSLGLRNPEITNPKPPRTKRILFLGDSYTFGWGVDEKDSYPKVVEQLLNISAKGMKIESINASLPGTGPNYDYMYLKKEGTSLAPDIVVVGYFMENDIPYDMYYEKWLETDEDRLPAKVQITWDYDNGGGNLQIFDLAPKFKVPVLRDSHLFSFAADRLTRYTPIVKLPINHTACLFKKNCRDLDEAKEKAKKVFLGMKKITDEKKSKLVVLFIPSEFQINPRTKNPLAKALLPADLDYPNKEFSAFFRENDIDNLDVTGKFRKETNSQFYFKEDNHWNEAGHKLAGEMLSEKLQEFLKTDQGL